MAKHIQARPARRGGYTLLGVLVFLTVSLLFVGLNQQRIGAILRIERASLSVDEHYEGAVLVLAKALSLLESGLPPLDPYECGVTSTTSTGSQLYSVRFASDGLGKWSIEVSPKTSLGNLPTLPSTFEK